MLGNKCGDFQFCELKIYLKDEAICPINRNLKRGWIKGWIYLSKQAIRNSITEFVQ